MTTARFFCLTLVVSVSVRLPAGGGNIPMESDKKKIQQTIDCFVRAYNAGDLAQLMNVYANDFVDMSDGQPTLQGAVAREDNALRLRDTFSKFNGHLTVHVEQIETAGDWAFDRGVLRVELHPKAGGPPVLVERRFLEIWRRDSDGQWRAIQSMDNSTQNPTGQSLDFRPSE
jgi:ketosteroid isomerase-like protein